MAATVAGRRKRGASPFPDDEAGQPPFAWPPQLQAKRGRCSPLADVADLGVSMDFDPVDALQLIFPGADPQLLRGYFEASGNVLDAAIRGFKDYLASGSAATDADAASSGVAATSDGPAMNTPTSGSEWAELIVKELSSSSDMIDAKNRAFRILELFDKSVANCNTPDENQKMREEHKILKQMLGGLLHQNGILKRAFLIQHNRLKEYQEMVKERSQFEEIVDKYQQQIKALEVNDFIHIAENSYSQQQILSSRAKAAESEEELEHIVFFTTMALMQYRLVSLCRLLVAACDVRCMLNKSPIWTGTLKHHIIVNELQLMKANHRRN